MGVQLHTILVQVGMEVVCAQHAGNFHKLVVVVMPLEEGVFAENLRVNQTKRVL